VRLSPSEGLRFAIAWTEDWAANYGVALLAIAGMLAVGIGVSSYALSGPVSTERGRIVGFGTYATQFGDQPLLKVEMSDGRVIELQAPDPIIRGCRVGSQIELMRRPHDLQVSPRGCVLGGGP
jgi:hypothetical protein